MPLPLVQIAGAALAAYAVTRALPRGRRDQRFEDALDELPAGLSAHVDRGRDGQASHRAQVGGRFRRVLRMPGDAGGLELDLGLIARLRVRRVA
jgi:hypothetical protein